MLYSLVGVAYFVLRLCIRIHHNLEFRQKPPGRTYGESFISCRTASWFEQFGLYIKYSRCISLTHYHISDAALARGVYDRLPNTVSLAPLNRVSIKIKHSNALTVAVCGHTKYDIWSYCVVNGNIVIKYWLLDMIFNWITILVINMQYIDMVDCTCTYIHIPQRYLTSRELEAQHKVCRINCLNR